MFFLIILLINHLIKLSIEEILINNRIKGSIKYALSSLENIPNKNDSIMFKYDKYKIIWNNFRIMSPVKEEIIINNSLYKLDQESYLISLENIKFTFIFDIEIFDNFDYSFKEKENFLEINSPNINYKYELKNNLLYFDSLNVSDFSFYLNSDSGFDALDYYQELTEMNKCFCKYDSDEDYVEGFPEVYIKQYLKNLIIYYISKIEINDILLTYDIKNIFEKSLNTVENITAKNNIYIFKSIKFEKIIIPFEKIETLKYNNNNLLLIHQMMFYGNFNLSGYSKEYEFNFQLNEEKSQVIKLFNNFLEFNFDNIIIKTNFKKGNKNDSDIIEALKFIILTNYTSILLDAKNEYYQNFNNTNL